MYRRAWWVILEKSSTTKKIKGSLAITLWCRRGTLRRFFISCQRFFEKHAACAVGKRSIFSRPKKDIAVQILGPWPPEIGDKAEPDTGPQKRAQ